MYKIIPSERFEKSAKILLKKYKSLRSELLELAKELAANPLSWAFPLANLAIKSVSELRVKGKAKVAVQGLLPT